MRRQPRIWVAAALLALSLCDSGCRSARAPRAHTGPQPAALSAARKACASANIVVICVDAARPDHVGCYGYGRPTTPEIDRLAAEGVRFARAVTDATYTLGAVGSLFSGQYPDTHGASVVGMRLPLGLTTLPEAGRAAGMRTAVFSSSGNIIKPHGFGDGVDDFVRVYTGDPAHGHVPDLLRAWNQWLDGARRQRFFAYVHIMPPHHPYEQSGQFRGRFDPDYAGALGATMEILFQLDAGAMRLSERDLRHLVAMYDEALAYGDWAVGQLVRGLRERNLLDRTILIVFSDHGEAFGEHGRFLHSNMVYNELTHIMLVLRLPAQVKGARSVMTGLAQLSDLAPTLASLAGLRLPPGQIQGFDLAPQMFGAAPVRHAAFSRCLRQPRVLRSVEINGAKGIFDEGGRLVELYDLEADPRQTRNLVRTERDLAQRIAGLYRAWAKQQKHLGPGVAAPTPAKVDKETREWLRSLGYLR